MIGVFSFFEGNTKSFFAYSIFVEFDKMQTPLKDTVRFIPVSFKIGLATIGVCVFVR